MSRPANPSRPPVGITLSKETLKRLEQMAAADSRNRSREVEWLIEAEWARRQTTLGHLTAGPRISKEPELSLQPLQKDTGAT